jgi:alpha-glucosidase
MNEPASFCNYPCTDPFAQATAQGLPPTRNTPKPDKGALILDQRPMNMNRRAYHGADEDLELPPYKIGNAAGAELGWKTADVSVLLSTSGLLLLFFIFEPK